MDSHCTRHTGLIIPIVQATCMHICAPVYPSRAGLIKHRHYPPAFCRGASMLRTSMGSASMSVRSAKRGNPDPTVATMPVRATGCLYAMPSASSWRRRYALVSSSSNPAQVLSAFRQNSLVFGNVLQAADGSIALIFVQCRKFALRAGHKSTPSVIFVRVASAIVTESAQHRVCVAAGAALHASVAFTALRQAAQRGTSHIEL